MSFFPLLVMLNQVKSFNSLMHSWCFILSSFNKLLIKNTCWVVTWSYCGSVTGKLEEVDFLEGHFLNTMDGLSFFFTT